MPHLRLSLLGNPQIILDGEPIERFRSIKVQALLAYLSIESDHLHSRELLASLLWPNEPDSVSRQNLRQSLYQLRRLFPDEDCPDPQYVPFLSITRQTAQFNTRSDHWLDVAEFSTCLKQGRIDEAVALYRGELLLGLFLEDSVPFEEWLTVTREQLHRQAMGALRQLTQQRQEAGDYEAAQTYAQKQLALEPWREEAHRQLMWVLAASGQRSAALAQYEICCHILDEELGVEPTDETTLLYEQIKEESLAFPAPVDRPSLSNLPPQTEPLIGRSKELEQLSELLPDPTYRLLTLVGEGGVGKTYLSLAAARLLMHRFADGVWLVPLAGINAPDPLGQKSPPGETEEAVVLAIAKSLGLTFSGQRTPKTELLEYLRGREMLLLLDNYEHLLETAALILEILERAPQITILVTSRERLNFRSEYAIRITGLPVPEADDDPAAATWSGVQLFVERAARTPGGFVLNKANLPHVVRICQLVEGLPLAIELAASWVEMLDCATIAQSITENLDFLSTTMRDVPLRHQSMRAVLEGSWRMLSPKEQTTLAQTAIFRGTFTLPAAQAVTETRFIELAQLVDKSLLQRTAPDRYGLHVLLRQFAAEKLAGMAGESDIPEDCEPLDGRLQSYVEKRHSDYYLGFLIEQEGELFGSQPQKPAAEIQSEWDNVQQATRWAVSQLQTESLEASLHIISRFLLLKGLFHQGETLLGAMIKQLERQVEANTSTAEQHRIQHLLSRSLIEQAHFLNEQGQYERAQSAARRGITLAEETTDGVAAALGRMQWGQAVGCQGNYRAAYSETKRAIAYIRKVQKRAHSEQAPAYRPDQLQRAEAAGLNQLGELANRQSFYVAAGDYFGQALQLYRETRDRRGETLALYNRAVVFVQAGYYGKAQETLQEILTNVREMGEPQGEGYALNSLGSILTVLGDYAAAQTHLEQALNIYREISNRQGECAVLMSLTQLYNHMEDPAKAHTYGQQARQIAQEIGDTLTVGRTLLYIGHALTELGELGQAAATYQQALHTHQELEHISLAIAALSGLARVSLLRGERARAQEYAEEVLGRLSIHTLDMISEPFRVYLNCHQVLQAEEDPRAQDILARAYHSLQAQASRIHDGDLQRSFLERVAIHRAVVQLYEQMQG